MERKGVVFILMSALMALAGSPATAGEPAEASLPTYLRDRGTGIPTSMFGTYVRSGELLVYPFFEYYRDHDFEYAPAEFGFGLNEDFRGRFRAHEELIFVAYGVSDSVAVEAEVAVITATLLKAAGDPTAMPARTRESGLGDVEGQVRWRWRKESATRPELFGFAELVVPHAGQRPLTGTPGVEAKIGSGITRGFGWGTVTARASLAYEEASSSHFDVGEYALEYVKRVSGRLRLYAGLEGTQDELELITEAQLRLGRHVTLKINNGLGLTSRATDWAPEVGILVALPRR